MCERFEVLDDDLDYVSVLISKTDFLGNISNIIRNIKNDVYIFIDGEDKQIIEFFSPGEHIRKAWSIWAAIKEDL